MPCAPFILLGTSLLILQTSLFPCFPGWFSQLDPLFILIVFIAVHIDIIRGTVLTIYFGMFTDILSGVYSGLHPIVYLALLFFIKGLSRILVLSESPHQIPLVISSYLFTSCFIYIITSSLAPEAALHWSWPALFIRFLMLALITIPCFKLYSFSMDKFNPQKALKFLIKPKRENRFRT
jgi:cell shape-determining protein MreD